MSFKLAGRTIEKVGVVGSGQIGPDIALHFAKFFAPSKTPVVVVDISQAALDAGRKRCEKKVAKGVEAGAYTEQSAKETIENLGFTTDYGMLKGAGLVVEAAVENLEIKKKIFGQLASIVGPETILASNSSHMTPDVIFEGFKSAGRALVTHYFFPADRNMLVEIVPGAATSPEVTEFLMRFYEHAGKLPVKMGSRYGFGVDPVFEGLVILACKIVEAGMCDHKQADAIAQKAIGLGVGPFTAMNLTGGNALVHPGAAGYNRHVMPFFEAPASMGEMLKAGKPWPAAGRDEKVEIPETMLREIGDLFMGAFFAFAADVVEAGIGSIGDLDLAVETGLVVKPPFALMNEVGAKRALETAEKAAKRFKGIKIAGLLRDQAKAGKPFRIPTVFRQDYGDVAVVRIRRPAVLNALNSGVVSELDSIFKSIRKDPAVKAAVLTGFGTKAFVSGADIRELATLKTPEEAAAFALKGQETLNLIENLGKPVVCAMNGLAFGGGCEIAMACSARVAAKGQKVFAGQPEPKLGIIPGFGGTQRLVRWTGFENAWPILRTGNPISSQKAREIGLIREEADPGELLDAAIRLARDAASGATRLPAIPKGPVPVPAAPADVDIGHLSRKIDEILRKAAVDGARMKLEDGLRHEAKMFGECVKTQDMKRGMENFIKNGPKTNAEFVHS